MKERERERERGSELTSETKSFGNVATALKEKRHFSILADPSQSGKGLVASSKICHGGLIFREGGAGVQINRKSGLNHRSTDDLLKNKVSRR